MRENSLSTPAPEAFRRIGSRPMRAPPPDSLDTFALMRRWQTFLEVSGRVGESTRRQYRRYLLSFLADTMKDLREVTEDDVVTYLAELPAKGHARGAALRALRSFYGWASERDEMPTNPVRRLKIPKPKYGPAPFLNEADLELVLTTAGEMDDPRIRPTLELMFATGGRVGSICALHVSDLHIEEPSPWLRFTTAKNDDPYDVWLGPLGVKACRELLALAEYRPSRSGRRRSTLVGVGTSRVEQWCQEIERRSGIACWPHLLRHTFADRLLNDPNVPPRVAASMMK